ncbi:Peptidyl-prolyl cis-trans isomerase FKBP42 [Diplonema papillatum]|nr:Peptidyl-prolyl cis-trans isomerase FKBP42 [Diplonema papillatum]
MSSDAKKEPSLRGNSDYSPEVKKMLKGWTEPAFGKGENVVLQQEDLAQASEEDGRREITWKAIHDECGYEKAAHGCRLTGDISQRDKHNWQYQKHVKLRDSDGTEHAVFFYIDEPYSFTYDDMEVGSLLTINSPRLHRFMDGQDGMRLDEEKQIGGIKKRPLTDFKRIDYAKLMRENGNRKYAEGKFEDAVEYYETAVTHVTGSSFLESAKLKAEARDLEHKCHTHIADAAAQLKNYTGAIEHCNKALAVNPKAAKAFFLLGMCHAARGNDRDALICYNKALDNASCDPSVSVADIKKELKKVAGDRNAQKSILKNMYSGFLDGGKVKKFGVKKGTLALSGGQLSAMQTLFNFRDIAAGKVQKKFNRKLLKNVLYRSSCVAAAALSDIRILCNEYGVKSVLDFRSAAERAAGPAQPKQFGVVSASVAAEGAVALAAKAGQNGKLPPPAVGEILEDTVVVEVDVLDSLFWAELDQAGRARYYLSKTFCQADKAESLKVTGTKAKLTNGELQRLILDEKQRELCWVMDFIADPANSPVVLTDSHGKDMAAIVSVLVLGCLGVDEDSIIEDYMESIDAIPEEAQKALAVTLTRSNLQLSHAFVDLADITDLLSFLDGRYNGIQAYLQHIGFDRAKQSAFRKTMLKG